MTEFPKDRLLALKAKAEQLRNTIEALKRDGHEHTDAQRQLEHMLKEIQAQEAVDSRTDRRAAS